jgi:hypothetical protein
MQILYYYTHLYNNRPAADAKIRQNISRWDILQKYSPRRIQQRWKRIVKCVDDLEFSDVERFLYMHSGCWSLHTHPLEQS